MGIEQSTVPANNPDDLDLTHMYEAAKRVFDDIEIFSKPEEYVDIEGAPVPLFDKDTPKINKNKNNQDKPKHKRSK